VEDEFVALVDHRFGDVLADLSLVGRMDAGDVGALELQKLGAETEVDAGRLDLLIDVVEGVDHEITLVEAGEDVGVRQDHTYVGDTEG